MKNLLNSTAPDAFKELLRSTHDLPFSHGPFGEAFCAVGAMFIGSVGKLESMDAEYDSMQPQPLPHEAFITIDWQLSMTPEAQTLLFRRVRITFDRVTGMVPQNLKKRYRMGTEELLRVRNMVVIFSQILGHLRARLSTEEVARWIEDVETGMGRDEDLMHLLHRRPNVFSLSMLLSHQEKASEDLQELERKKVEQVECQRQEVLAAQWKYFCAALEKDQEGLTIVQRAPAQVRQKLHVKQVAHRGKAIAAAEAACAGYQERMTILSKPHDFSLI